MQFYLRNNKLRHLLVRFAIEVAIWGRHMTLRRFLNHLRNTFELRTRKTVLRSLPPRVYIETTNVCNLRCPYCVNITRPHNAIGTMDMETFSRVVADIAPYSVATRLYNQGDPFMDRHVLDRLRVLKKHKLSTILVTNFSMPMKDETIEEIVALAPSHIVACFESLRQEAYAAYRVGGKIENVIHNIERLVAAKKRAGTLFPFISLRVFITKLNENELDEIYEFFSRSGADNILFVPMYVNMNDQEAVDTWLPLDERHRFKPDAAPDRVFCAELWNYPVVNFQGRLIPCCLIFDYDEYLADLNGKSFREAWNSEPYVRARQYFKDYKPVPVQGNVCLRCKGKLKSYSD